jgi:hypothetical protein
MSTRVIKHTTEALAFFTLYKTMPAEVKEELKEMISTEAENEDAILFTSLSLKSWEADDDIEENKVWEKLYNDHKRI